MAITGPLSRRLAFGRNSQVLQKILIRVEKLLNRRLTTRYAKKHLQPAPVQLVPQPRDTERTIS